MPRMVTSQPGPAPSPADAGRGGEVDVVVLGLGPGGEDAAGRLAEAGLRVLAGDHNLGGGEGPYWGGGPTKMMTPAAAAPPGARPGAGLAGAGRGGGPGRSP